MWYKKRKRLVPSRSTEYRTVLSVVFGRQSTLYDHRSLKEKEETMGWRRMMVVAVVIVFLRSQHVYYRLNFYGVLSLR